MDCKSLMIGDLVCYDGDVEYTYPVKVDGLTTDDISLDGEGFLGGIDGMVMPIPLTEEMLQKNLEKECEDEVDGGWYFNADNSTIWGILDKEGFWLNFNGQQDMILIHYVHDLQHALRLCGLNDLADNFKV